MDNVIVLATALFELLAIIFCLHIFFGKKVVWDLYLVALVICECFVMFFVRLGWIPQVGLLPLYFFLWIFCYLKFKQTIWMTSLKFFHTIAVCGVIEAILLCPNVVLQALISEHVLFFLDSGSLLL